MTDRPAVIRPATVTNAVRVLVLLVAVAGVTTILIWVRRDDLVRSWAEGNRTARDVLARGGLEAVESTLTVPGIVPIALTSFVVFVSLAWVLGVFFAEGFAWARWSLAVTALFAIFAAVLCIGSGIPALFVGLSLLISAICLVLLVLLFHKDTNDYLKAL